MRRSTLGLALCAYSFLIVLMPSTTRANWPDDGLPVCDAPYDQLQVEACEDGAGGALVVWKDQRVIDYGIYVQRISVSGQTQWNEDGVRISTAFHSVWAPCIVGDGVGGAWVFWEDRTNPYVDLRMQHVDGNGVATLTNGGVLIRSGTTFFSPRDPVCASDGSGGAVVAFVEEISTGGSQVVAQRFDSDGDPQWTTPAAVVGADIGDDELLDIDFHHPLGTGVLLAWVSSNGHGVMQWVDAAGTPMWSTTGGYGVGVVPAGSRVKVARRERSTGGAYLLYQGTSSIGPTVYKHWSVLGIEDNRYVRVQVSFGSNPGTGPDANIDRAFDGGFVVGWYDYDAATDHVRIWGRMYDADENLGWEQYLGQGTPVGAGVAPAVLYTNTYFGHRFVWPMMSEGEPVLWFRTMGRDPGFAIPDPGAAPLPGTSSSLAPALVAHDELSDKVFVVWRDQRRVTETDVYANLFNPSAVIPHANLQVRSFAPQENPQEVGEPVDWRAVVVNQSSIPADGFSVGYWRDAVSPAGAPDWQSVVVGGLAAGDSVEIEFQDLLAPTTATSWHSWFVTDLDDEIDEGANEDDNAHSFDLEWLARPDLTITSFTVNSSQPEVGQDITYDITVTNNGHASTGTYQIRLYLDPTTPPGVGDVGDFSYGTAPLAAGASITVHATTASEGLDLWSSYAYVDAVDAVEEWKENNNRAGPLSVTWTLPENPGWPVSAGSVALHSPVIASLPTTPPGLRSVVVTAEDGQVYAWDGQGDVLDGWPIDVSSAIATSAAVADVDADGEPEVVVATEDGRVILVSSRGREVWSTNVGASVVTTPAIIDLAANAMPLLEIVVATTAGEVYVLDAAGSVCPGWPVDLGESIESSPAVGNVAAVGNPVVAVAAIQKSGGTQIHVLGADGLGVGGRWPVTLLERVSAGLALGDVLGDARLEVCVADEGGGLHALSSVLGEPDMHLDLGSPAHTSLALAKHDPLDAKLTLFVAGDTYVPVQPIGGHWISHVWAVKGTGTVLTGWPVAMADRSFDCRSGDGPVVWHEAKTLRIAVGSERGKVFVFDRNGAKPTGETMTTTGAIQGAVAVGDIDGDRRLELVVAGVGTVDVFDLLEEGYHLSSMQWAQLGHDGSHTRCYGLGSITAIDDPPTPPIARTGWLLPRPNPFNPRVTLPFELLTAARVEARVYDVAGRRVIELERGWWLAGRHELQWDGRDASGARVASGVYVVELRAGEVRDQTRVVLIE